MGSTMIHVRVDEAVKEKAVEALDAMGLTLADAVRVLLVRIGVEKALPFALKVPNPETLQAMEEADKIARESNARFTRAADLFDNLQAHGGE